MEFLIKSDIFKIQMENTESYKAFLNSPYKSNKWSTYFDVYDKLFKKYCGKNITFVEIGVLGGGSLFMWRNFFGPKARIIGIDLNPNAKKWEADGFEIYIGSQSDKNFWKEFINKVGKVDIVLDDGGHTYYQQIITTELLLKNINDGGLLVIEDTHTSYMKNFGSQKYSFINYTKKLIDKLNRRFNMFDNEKADYRFWSIEIFESIIVFKINKKKSNLKSIKIRNRGNDDKAVYYKTFNDMDYKRIIFKLPIVKSFAYRIITFFNIRSEINKIKNYFK